jgi:hypothetical protein
VHVLTRVHVSVWEGGRAADRPLGLAAAALDGNAVLIAGSFAHTLAYGNQGDLLKYAPPAQCICVSVCRCE